MTGPMFLGSSRTSPPENLCCIRNAAREWNRNSTRSRKSINSLFLGFLPGLGLLPALPDAQLLQKHIAPVVGRAIAATHLALLLEEGPEASRAGAGGVAVTLDGTHSALELFHLFGHASLGPFLGGAGDVLLVGQELVELATDDGCVVVAGDFAVEFIEGDVAEIVVLRLDFGGGFGEFGFGGGFRVGVLFVGIGLGGGAFGRFGFGVGGDASVVVFGGEGFGFGHIDVCCAWWK